MSRRTDANRIIRKHVLWSMGAGLMPVPLLDVAAVTAIQMDMLKQLASVYVASYSASQGKTFVAALTGSTFARVGATMVKALPGIGTIVGGISMSMLSGSSTYAVGKIAIDVFHAGGDLSSADLDSAKEAYEEAFEEGKGFASGLGKAGKDAQDLFQALEKLSELKGKGVITEGDFETQK